MEALVELVGKEFRHKEIVVEKVLLVAPPPLAEGVEQEQLD